MASRRHHSLRGPPHRRRRRRRRRRPAAPPHLQFLGAASLLQRRIPGTLPPALVRLALRTRLAALGMAPPAKRGREPRAPSPPRAAKKKRTPTPELSARLAVQMAAREGDAAAAFLAYDAARAAGVRLAADSYATIMFLCSGGDAWGGGDAGGRDGGAAAAAAAAADEGGAAAAPAIAPEHAARAAALLADMEAAGLAPSEMCFTALARIAAAEGRPADALAAALQVAERGLTPRLRCFTPALAAYVRAGDGAAAFAVDDAALAAGLEPGEPELALLLRGAAAGGVAWPRVEAALRRLSREHTTLSAATLAAARALFESPAAAAAAPAGAARWRVEACAVDAAGALSARGAGALAALDLDAAEYAEFCSGVAALAARQGRQPADFPAFVAWLEANGPFAAVVDAANVAFFGQNFESGGFSFAQVEAVVGALEAELPPGARPLVVLHVARTRAPAAARPEAAALLARLRAAGSFYAAPPGSNDDWYWMYAAVAAGPRGLLVSNDELRDHIFQLLAPRYVGRWKERHQLRYSFDAEGKPRFERPPPYTTCAQRVEATGAWAFPGAGGAWLAAVPE